jgi:ribose transport system permease protein
MAVTTNTTNATLDQVIARKQRTWVNQLLNSQAFWVAVAIVVACIYLAFAAKNGAFTTPQNIYNITRNFAFTAIIALGMTLVIILGGIDLSVGSVLCLCSMVIAVVMHNGASLEVGIFAAIAVALAVGAFNGVLIAYLGFPPFVVTLGMLSIARSIAMTISSNTTVHEFGPDHDRLLSLGGGAFTPFNIPWLKTVDGVQQWVWQPFSISNPLIYMIILAVLTAFVLRWTRFGRYVFAIGGNEHAATLTGIPVRPMKVAVYMISALSAGVAGIIQTGWLGAVTTNIGSGLELQVIAAAVIGGASLAGGVGTAAGAVVGAALIEIVRNSLGLLGINAFWQGTVIGGAIIIAVAFERVRSLRSRD